MAKAGQSLEGLHGATQVRAKGPRLEWPLSRAAERTVTLRDNLLSTTSPC